MKKKGYTTFFIFINPNLEYILNELNDFDSSSLLFLKNLLKFEIKIGTTINKYVLKKNKINDYEYILQSNINEHDWYIVSENNISLAFNFNEKKGFLPCSNEESVFHCFLPTLEKVGFYFKINGDFSTDPTRKYIHFDEISKNYLSSAIDLLAKFTHTTIKKNFIFGISLLNLLCSKSIFSKESNFIENELFMRLSSYAWIEMKNGDFVTPRYIKLLPHWLEYDEKIDLANKIDYLSNFCVNYEKYTEIKNLDYILNKMESITFTNFELYELLSNINIINRIMPDLTGKLFVYILKSNLSITNIMDNVFVPLESGFIKLVDSNKDNKFNKEFLKYIKNNFNSSDINNLIINYPIFLQLLKTEKNDEKKVLINKKKVISEGIESWKTPLQNCMTIESLEGNEIVLPKKKCTDYDFISKKDNVLSYITVKNINSLNNEFYLTNNEYMALYKYGNHYKIYLFFNDSQEVQYLKIENPIENLEMKKVVKEWEWACNYNEHRLVNNSLSTKEIFLESVFEDIDNQTGIEFERFCAKLLIKNGYKDISYTQTTGDQGVDIIAFRDKVKFGFQCKCYSSTIGNSAIQEISSGINFYKCNIGIVITNQYFTESAKKLAAFNNIILWDRDIILEMKNSI